MSTEDKNRKISENQETPNNNCCLFFLCPTKSTQTQPYNLPEKLLKDQMISKPKKTKNCCLFEEIEQKETKISSTKEIPQIEIHIEPQKKVVEEKTKEEEILDLNIGSSSTVPTILLNDIVISPQFLTNPLTNLFGEEIERKMSENVETLAFGLDVISTEYSNSHQTQEFEEEKDETDSDQEVDHPDILKYLGTSF
jgi:hypothetical protein